MISRIALSAALLCFAVTAAVADRPMTFPGGRIDSSTLRAQEKVDELFERGDYERALFIYKNELAPIGDKYAQYMIGHMYWTGTGVAEDPVTASAWFRLAAERSNPQFIAVRDSLIDSLSEPESARSDELFLQLRQRYADAAILLRLVRKDVAELRAQTGSRVTNSVSPLTIFDPRSGLTESADVRDRRLRKRAEECVQFLAQLLGDGELDADLNKLNLDELEARVNQHVMTISDRPVSASEARR